MDTSTLIATSLQLVGLLLVAAGLVVSSRRDTEARDTAIVINVGLDYRQRWESGAREVVGRLERRGDAAASPDDHAALVAMLNWVDWLGVLIKHRALRKPGLVLDTIGPSMARILELGYPAIDTETARHGGDYWAGVVEVGERLAERGLLDRQRYPRFARSAVT